MNSIDNYNKDRTPVIYITGIQHDVDGALRAWLKAAVAAFSPQAISVPKAIVIDHTDYNCLSPAALNEFLVDADVDAVVWSAVPSVGGLRRFHFAVARYPKVTFSGREAKKFTIEISNSGEIGIGRILAANMLGATLSEIADIRPASSNLISDCICAMESALSSPLERDLYLATLDHLQSLYFVVRNDEHRQRNLRRAIELNERLCGELDEADTARIAQLTKTRSRAQTELGACTSDVKEILSAITGLKKVAPHVVSDIDRASLDALLAACKTELGVILDDPEILSSARDLLRDIIPVLYRNLAIESWADAQSNLSAACWHLYGATSDFEHAVEALDTMHEALSVYNPKSFPYNWAKAKKSLGSMLSALGEDPENIDALYCGIDCLRDALTVYTRDKVPMYYAATSADLARSLCTLTDHTNDKDHLQSAESCLRTALEVYAPKQHPSTADIANRLHDVRRRISASG